MTSQVRNLRCRSIVASCTWFVTFAWHRALARRGCKRSHMVEGDLEKENPCPLRHVPPYSIEKAIQYGKTAYTKRPEDGSRCRQ